LACTIPIAENAVNKIEVVIMPPTLHPMDALPPAAARTKKKRKKVAAPAAPAAASNYALTAMPAPSTAAAKKKGKMTDKKKSTEPINLGHCQCGCQQPTLHSIALWQWPMSKNGSPAMLGQSQATLLMNPHLIIDGTR
jgi:hypothetical protein